MSITSTDMAGICECSYRTLDYWARRDWLQPEPGEDGRAGSGIKRKWPESEIPVAAAMVKLVNAGIAHARAAAIARHGDPGTVLEVLASQPEGT